ncbi:MAG: ATP-binding protein [Chloroflexota bacterium]
MNRERTTNFGMLIHRSRQDAGLTQEGLAERAGVSARTISDLERGVVSAPRRDTLELLADAFDLSREEREYWERERQRIAQRSTAESGETTIRIPAPARPPTSLSPLIGREQEMAEILEIFDRPKTRLLTVTGAGGVGKTRLAAAVADALEDRYPDGTAFAGLASIDDPELLLSRIASAIGLRDEAGQPPMTALTSYLRDQRFLLVLDNFEHLLSGASMISDLLIACPNLSIIVTSRAPLRIQGEQLYPINPLHVPDSVQSGRGSDLEGADAIALFLARARAVKPDFELTDENAELVLEICRRLDGLPLAIELAAARISVLSPAVLLERLRQRLPLLTGGLRDASDRQRTLQNTIAWGYDLLTPEQQRTLQLMSVFRNGWTLEAATAVAGEPPNELETLDTLSTLVWHSLIVRDERPGGDVRFDMLATIHEFAWNQLTASGEAAYAGHRHARYFSHLVDEHRVRINGPEQIASYDLFEQEHDNLHAALTWLQEQGEIDTAMHMAATLGQFWLTRGYIAEGREVLEFLVRRKDECLDPTSYARALLALAALRWIQGDLQDTVAMSEEATAILESHDVREHLPRAHVTTGIMRAFQGDSEGAMMDWERAAARAREVGNDAHLARALTNLGFLARARPDHEQAMALFAEAVAAARTSGNPEVLALALENLGRIHRDQGDHIQAAHLLHESFDLCCATGKRWGIAASLESIAEVALARGQPVPATRFVAAAASLRERIGVPLQSFERDDYERLLANLRTMLGEDFELVWTAGRTLPIEDAIAEVQELAPALKTDWAASAGS